MSPMLLMGLGLLATAAAHPQVMIKFDFGSLDRYRNFEPKWDVLIFTQSWPYTVCREWKDKSESHACLLLSQWTVHGVWPTKFGTIGPGFCNNTWHFNPRELKPIQSELDQKWANIMNGTAEDSLWKHEWQKHGTCAAQLPPLDSELKYFSKGLAWHDEHNMTKILSDGGILPDATKEYNVQQINDVVKKGTGFNPAVECFRDSKTHKTYLSEIRICFNKQLELVDCDGIVLASKYSGLDHPTYKGLDVITNCHEEEKIIYPDNVPEPELEQPAVKKQEKKSFFDFEELIKTFKTLKVLQWLTF
ncbi:ribonuclease Oy [Neocloeon triangulifer]|uniref:ribonuclease Oy n=1 Tax=Neocloeon triangulifer TaxID=2078957 RepID=UPI00286F0822|nr:ribonuclease Oy [Neocloeon triangulifer]